jgi:flagellar biosynthesis/type III secretory pathway protein FliH
MPAMFEFERLEPRVAPGRRFEDPQALVAAARAEADAIRAAAHAEGFAAGHAEVVAATEAALAGPVAALAEAHAALVAERDGLAAAVEAHAVTLALHLAERVLAGSLAVQPERVVDVVRGALRCLVERDRVLVLVNPADLETVRGAAGDLVGTLGGINVLDVQAERRVSPGGAIVRTAVGEVDAQLETKLARAREAVEAAL